MKRKFTWKKEVETRMGLLYDSSLIAGCNAYL